MEQPSDLSTPELGGEYDETEIKFNKIAKINDEIAILEASLDLDLKAISEKDDDEQKKVRVEIIERKEERFTLMTIEENIDLMNKNYDGGKYLFSEEHFGRKELIDKMLLDVSGSSILNALGEIDQEKILAAAKKYNWKPLKAKTRGQGIKQSN